MFCMECGTKLPDNAKFCMNCGTPTGKTAAPAAPAAPAPRSTPAATPKAWPVYGCSEKANGMVYVPGKGLYFLADSDQKIMFLPEGGKKASVLVRKGKSYQDYKGLNYWKGNLYAYRDSGEDYGIVQVDTETGEKKMMKLSQNIHISCNNRFMVKNGIGYSNSGYANKLICVDLATGKVEERPLPDMRAIPLPDSWCEDRCIDPDRRDKFNYGEHWDGFYLHGDYGYVSVSGLSTHTVRFRLDDPSDFSYMPVNSCTAYADYAMISTLGNLVLGNGGDGTGLHGTATEEDSVAAEAKQLFGSLPRYDIKDWWRVGKKYVFGDLLIDFDTKKAKKLRISLQADDFAECEDGSVYLYQKNNGIYRLPAIFDTLFYREEDLEEFQVYKED